MKKVLFTQLLLCFFQLNSFSQAEWKIINVEMDSVNQTVTEYYIDTSYSAIDQYGNNKVWTRIEYDNPLGKGKKKSTLTDALFSIDCIQKRVIELEEITRKPSDGAMIKHTRLNPTPNDWQNVVPGTNGELLLRVVCK